MEYIFRDICQKGIRIDSSLLYNSTRKYVMCEKCKKENMTLYKKLDTCEYVLCMECVILIRQSMNKNTNGDYCSESSLLNNLTDNNEIKQISKIEFNSVPNTLMQQSAVKNKSKGLDIHDLYANCEPKKGCLKKRLFD